MPDPAKGVWKSLNNDIRAMNGLYSVESDRMRLKEFADDLLRYFSAITAETLQSKPLNVWGLHPKKGKGALKHYLRPKKASGPYEARPIL